MSNFNNGGLAPWHSSLFAFLVASFALSGFFEPRSLTDETESHSMALSDVTRPFLPPMPPAKNTSKSSRMRLTDLPNGARGRVTTLDGESGTCARLREMGFCESAVIEKIAGQKTLLCQVCGARIALSDRAANSIVVELIRGGV